jgi:hypothetical protein
MGHWQWFIQEKTPSSLVCFDRQETHFPSFLFLKIGWLSRSKGNSMFQRKRGTFFSWAVLFQTTEFEKLWPTLFFATCLVFPNRGRGYIAIVYILFKKAKHKVKEQVSCIHELIKSVRVYKNQAARATSGVWIYLFSHYASL